MELRRDLLKIDKKSVSRIILGVGFFIVAAGWLIDQHIDNQVVKFFDWLFFGTMAINGIFHLFEGFGYSFSKLFGKAFILIDNNEIRIKNGVFDEEQSILWKDVKSINYKPNIFQILKLDDTFVALKLQDLEYSRIREIKDAIRIIAHEKGVQISL